MSAIIDFSKWAYYCTLGVGVSIGILYPAIEYWRTLLRRGVERPGTERNSNYILIIQLFGSVHVSNAIEWSNLSVFNVGGVVRIGDINSQIVENTVAAVASQKRLLLADNASEASASSAANPIVGCVDQSASFVRKPFDIT